MPIAYAQNLLVKAQEGEGEKQEVWREYPLKERLENALIKGVGDHLEEDLKEALKEYPRAVDIIDGPLMGGMNKVGELFGAEKGSRHLATGDRGRKGLFRFC